MNLRLLSVLSLAACLPVTLGSCYYSSSITRRTFVGIGPFQAEFPAEAKHEERSALDVEAGETITVRTVRGTIRVRNRDGDAALEARMAIRGRTQEEADATLAGYRIVRAERNDGVHFEIEGDPIRFTEGRTTTTLAPSIDLTLYVPSGVRLDLLTKAGAIDASGAAGPSRFESRYGKVTVDSVVGDVEARSGSGSVTIRNVRDGEIHAHSGYGSIEVSRADDCRVIATAASGRITLTRVRGHARATTSYGNVEAKRISGTLEVDSASGRIKIEDVEGDKVTLRTSYGRIETRDVIANEVHARTGSGSIGMRNLQASIDAESGYGAIRIEGALRNVAVQTTSGGIHIRTTRKPTGNETLRAHSRYGAILLSAPSDLDADVELRTGYGSATCDFELSRDKSGRRISGRVGSGGPSVQLVATNGDVALRRL